jgi:hypothetical protein
MPCPERDPGKGHEWDAGECCYCGTPKPPPSIRVIARITERRAAIESDPVYRRNMREAGRGHLLS